MEKCTLQNVNSCWKTKIYSYLETFGGQNFNLHLNVVNIFNTELIRHLQQLKTVVFLHRCIMRAVLLQQVKDILNYSIVFCTENL
jgi:hypothetical protein